MVLVVGANEMECDMIINEVLTFISILKLIPYINESIIINGSSIDINYFTAS